MDSSKDPTKEWVWSAPHSDYYRQHWNPASGQWLTLWASQQRRDSVAPEAAAAQWSAPPSASSATADLPRGTIQGHPERGEYEPLDSSYTMRPRKFFAQGRVFSILFTEPLGANATNLGSDNVTVVMYGERAYSQIRRFVVVREGRGFCYACPISTYGGRGTGKPGLDPSTHAIIHTVHANAEYVPGEQALEKRPITIVPADNTVTLTPASRINFALHHPIQHNVKVKDLGMVLPDLMPTLIHYARIESGWDPTP